MHLARTNLHFKRLSTRPDHCGVKRLIQVELRHGDVVLESTHNGSPLAVNATKCAITITHTVDNDAKRYQVEDFVKVFVLLNHLFVDAPQVLAATRDIPDDVHICQTRANFGNCCL